MKNRNLLALQAHQFDSMDMEDDYTLIFDSISDGWSSIRVIDYYSPEGRLVGLSIDDEALSFRVKGEFPCIVADLFDLGLDHSRSVNPITLRLVSEVVTELLREEFKVRNPFLFWTKARMCRALAEDKRVEMVAETKSCDSPHRQKPSQCGYCTSCLLRRQALAAAGIDDLTSYVISNGNKPACEPSLPLRNMLLQVQKLDQMLNNSKPSVSSWESLTREFYQLDDIVDSCAISEGLLPVEMQKKLVNLYQNYVNEWIGVESQISLGLISEKESQQIARRDGATLPAS